MRAPEISIIVPVFNEEGNVLPLAAEIAEAMAGVGRSHEIVFVDDASADATWERISEAQTQDHHVRALRHEHNAGQSAALWTGIQNTTSPILVTLDGDGQNDPADLPRLLAEMENCDFVCGVRGERQDDWLRRLSAQVARQARRWVLTVDFRDTGCAFRAFKREALKGVFPFNGFHRFLPMLVHASGARVREIAIGHRPRMAGESKYGVANRLWRGIYDLIALSWYQKRRLSRMVTTELPRVEAAPPRDPGWSGHEPRIKTRSPESQPVEHR